MASEKKVKCLCRRDFIKSAGAWVLATGMGANIILPVGTHAGKKKLKILQWKHTDAEFDLWFESFAKEWGKKNDTEVDLSWDDCG